MTVVSKGSNPIQSSPVTKKSSQPIITDVIEHVSSRPDRNTHNGQQAQIHAISEENKQQMMEAVRTILESVGEDPERD